MRQETERLRLQGYTPRVRVYFFSVYPQWSLGTQLSQCQAFLSFVISLQLLPHPPHLNHFCLEFFSSCILYLPLFICLLGSIEMTCLVIVLTGFLNVCPVCWQHHFLTSWFTGTYVQVFFFNCILWYKSCVDNYMWLLKCWSAKVWETILGQRWQKCSKSEENYLLRWIYNNCGDNLLGDTGERTLIAILRNRLDMGKMHAYWVPIH